MEAEELEDYIDDEEDLMFSLAKIERTVVGC